MTRMWIGMLVLATVVASGISRGAAQVARSGLVGTTTAAGGATLEGVMVSARAHGSSITTSVLTDDRGEYVFPPLDSGQYDVWAQATGYQPARAVVTIEHGRPARRAFALNAIDDIVPQLNATEWFSAMPEETKEQRRMKAIFRTNCTACHGPTHALQNRFDENGWRAIVMFMERMTGTGGINRHTTVVHYRDELARYQPRRMGADKRGEYVWVPNNVGNNVARIDIHSLDVKYYRVEGNPYFVTVDKDSNVWTNLFSDARVGRLNPRTEQWTYYTLPSRCESRNISVDDRRGDVSVPCANAMTCARSWRRSP